MLISLQNRIVRQYIEEAGGKRTNGETTINITFNLKTTLDLTKNRLDDLEKQMNKTEEGEQNLVSSPGVCTERTEKVAAPGRKVRERHILGSLLEETDLSRPCRGCWSRGERSGLLGREGVAREAMRNIELTWLSGLPGHSQSPVLWTQQSAGSKSSVAMDFQGTVRAGKCQ